MNSWIAYLAAEQDYGWFIASLLWLCVMAVWWRDGRTQPHWRWVPWSAMTAIATAFVELITQITPTAPQPREAFHPFADWLLGVIAATQIAGWLFSCIEAHSPRARNLRALAWGAVLAVALLRDRFPLLGGGAVVLFTLVTVVFLTWKGRPLAPVRNVLILAALTIPLGSWSLVAEAFHLARRWTDINPIGLVSVLSHLAASAAALAALSHARVASLYREEPRHAQREWKIFFGLLGAWMLAGIALTWLAAQSARSALENAIRIQAALAAKSIDTVALARAFGGGLRIDRREKLGAQPNGIPVLVAVSDTLAKADTVPIQRQLAQLQGTIPLIESAVIVTLIEDRIYGCIFPAGGRQRTPGILSDRGLATEEQWQSWNNRHAPVKFYGPAHTPWRDRVSVWTPLRHTEALGWLEINFQVGAWLRSQALARWQMFAITGLGSVAGVLIFLQRLRMRERALIARQAEAAASANALKTAFLAKVSHELRTPIQTVLGYGEWLEREAAAAQDRARASALRQHAGLMLRLVNDLLDIGALESGTFRLAVRTFSPAAILEHAMTSLRFQAEAKGLRLLSKTADDLPAHVSGDPDRFNQIITNLIGNAVKYTDAGHVSVSLRGTMTKQGAHELLLAVSDTGPGIPAAQRSSLFEPFARLAQTADKQGTGLGLSLVAGLCRQMQGSVNVDSTPGNGATFEARMIFAAADTEIATPANRPALTGRSVLVAEDNPLVRDLFEHYLTSCGARCTVVADGATALTSALSGQHDVIVLDLSLPRMSGLEVAQRIRLNPTSTSRLRIVGVSAHASSADRDVALAAGMDAFLPKPVTLDQLAQAIVPNDATVAIRPPDALQLRLRRRFQRAAAEQAEAVRRAIAAQDWEAAGSRCHYLKNSAGAVEDLALYDACGELEAEIRGGKPAAIEAAWTRCYAQVQAWISPHDVPDPTNRNVTNN